MGLLPRRAAVLAVLAALPGTVLGADAGGGNPAGPFSSFLGGSSTDAVTAVAAGPDGALYVVGTTSSSDFPLASPLQGALAGGSDAFVAKVASDGRTLLWSTFLGGTADDGALAVAAAPDGSVWVAGSTASTDFPLAGPLQTENGGDETGFLARLSADGAVLLSSTYLGGSGTDRIQAIALDGGGNPWVAGTTDSVDFATTPDAILAAPAGGEDAFAARVSSDGATLLHATYLGGTGRDAALALALDASGAVAIAGRTDSEDFPALGEWQPGNGGGLDAFLLVLNEIDGTLRSSTCLGGEGDDEAACIAVRSTGIYVLAGRTSSPDFPNTGGLTPFPAGGADAFVAVTGYQASSLDFCSLLGGTGDDGAAALSVDGNGNLLVAGTTDSPDFPLHAAGQPSPAGGTDGFVARIHSAGGGLLYSSYFGGSGDDALLALSLDGTGAPRVGGRTDSADFPLRVPFQSAPGGTMDGLFAAPLVAPRAPERFRATAVGHDSVSLSWDDPTAGRSTFRMERRIGTGSWSLFADLPAGAVDLVDGSVAPSTNYSYRLRLSLDGDLSSWTLPVTLTTPMVPVPLPPGAVSALVLDPRSVALAWEDRSDREITYEVYRSVDGGPFAFLQTLPAGTTATTDSSAEPDRTLYYAVRAVGVSGPSPFANSGEARTPATLEVSLLGGRRIDGPKSRKDSLRLEALLTLGTGAVLDPAAEGLRVTLGAGKDAWVLDIAPHTPGWKVRKGVWTWKSPRGTTAKTTLVLDAATGSLRVAAKKLDLAAAAAGALRLAVRCGMEAGSSSGDWVEEKPGRLAYE